MSSLHQNPKGFIGVLVSISISGDTGSYLSELVMLINLECTLAQTRMALNRVTLSSKGPMRGQYVLNLKVVFICFLFSMSVSGDSASVCLK